MKKKVANSDIRLEMFKRGISQNDLAQKLNVCEQTVFRMLRNELPKEKKDELLNIIENYELY